MSFENVKYFDKELGIGYNPKDYADLRKPESKPETYYGHIRDIGSGVWKVITPSFSFEATSDALELWMQFVDEWHEQGKNKLSRNPDLVTFLSTFCAKERQCIQNVEM